MVGTIGREEGVEVPSAAATGKEQIDAVRVGELGNELGFGVMITMMWGYDLGWGPWLGMSLGMTVFWGLIIVTVIALVRYMGGMGGRGTHGEDNGRGTAEQILADRFARGEIDEDEYRQRRSLLREGR